VASGRTLVRASQIRRSDGVASSADEGQVTLGRYFSADCLLADAIGSFVRITGVAVAGIAQVATVNIAITGQYPAVGVIIEKSTTTRCLVQVIGELQVSPPTLIPGRPYFIDVDGTITDVPPVPASGTVVAIQAIGTAIDIGRLLLNVHPQLFLRGG